jgi:lysophospholipase L1-like esterase
MKIAIFGDSITAGWIGGGVSKILKEKIDLNLSNLGIADAEVRLFGVPGDTTTLCLKRMDPLIEFSPDILFVFFGANDSASHYDVSKNSFAANLKEIVSRMEGSRVVLLTPPYVEETRVDYSRNNRQVEEYREVVLNLSKSKSIEVVDVYQAMRNWSDPKTYLQSDGLHFSESGYDLLSGLLIGSIQKNQRGK